MCVSLLNANADTMVGHPGENWWFILSTSPLELDIICGRLAYDLPLGCARRRRAHVCLASQRQRRHHGIASGFHVELSCLVGLAGLDTEHTIPRCWPFSALGTQKLRAVQNCGNWRRHVMSTERCTFGCAAGGRRAHVCLAPQHQHRHHGIVSAIPSSSLLVSMKVQAGPQHEGPSRPAARAEGRSKQALW